MLVVGLVGHWLLGLACGGLGLGILPLVAHAYCILRLGDPTRNMGRPHSMPNFPPRRWVALIVAKCSPNGRSLNIRELRMPLLSMAPHRVRKGTHHAINARGAHIVDDMGRCTSTSMFVKRIKIGC